MQINIQILLLKYALDFKLNIINHENQNIEIDIIIFQSVV